ncbi:MAG: acetylxylan esterase, partial [Bacteroidales bacterium]|nr:acetylxylan esterase [Bacteroidales bacterium]
LMDYFEKDPDVDATRVAITGCSRLGKTTIWTGAIEPRIKVVMPSCSGEGGAAMSRRNYGETVAHLAEKTRFPYQFCPKYGYWGSRVHEMPVDAHMLVALIAPRPLLLQTGSTDNWSDPKGEWISLLEARKVYQLLGQDVPAGDEMPAPDQPVYSTLGYVMHNGGHGVMPQDWTFYLEFMKRHL